MRLESQLTIYDVEALKPQLLTLLNEEKITLDLGSVEKIDMVGIQLLLSFMQSAKAQNITVQFSNIDPSIRHALTTTNTHTLLGIDDA